MESVVLRKSSTEASPRHIIRSTGGLGYWIGYGVDQEVCLPLEKE